MDNWRLRRSQVLALSATLTGTEACPVYGGGVCLSADNAPLDLDPARLFLDRLLTLVGELPLPQRPCRLGCGQDLVFFRPSFGLTEG